MTDATITKARTVVVVVASASASLIMVLVVIQLVSVVFDAAASRILEWLMGFVAVFIGGGAGYQKYRVRKQGGV